MYWIKPKKRYDPTPYSRILRFWHKLFGCPIKTGEWKHRHDGHWIFCPCGLVWHTEKERA